MLGQQKKETISLSELDDKLMADKSGAYKKQLLEKLSNYLTKVSGKINRGELSPEEFAVAKKVEDALKAAEALIKDR